MKQGWTLQSRVVLVSLILSLLGLSNMWRPRACAGLGPFVAVKVGVMPVVNKMGSGLGKKGY